MYCCGQRMIRVRYYARKGKKWKALFCTECGRLVTASGIRIWYGNKIERREAL